MAPSILDALLAKNPITDCGYVPVGPNTSNSRWAPVKTWRPWKDFAYDNLFSIYRNVLLSPYIGTIQPQPGCAYD